MSRSGCGTALYFREVSMVAKRPNPVTAEYYLANASEKEFVAAFYSNEDI
jgi:hypothetical protein